MANHASHGQRASFIDNGLVYSLLIGSFWFIVTILLAAAVFHLIFDREEIDWVSMISINFIWIPMFVSSHYSSIKGQKGESPTRTDLKTHQMRQVSSEFSLEKIEDILRSTKKWNWAIISRTDNHIELKTKKNWIDDWGGYIFSIHLKKGEEGQSEYQVSTRPSWRTVSADFGKSYKYANQLTDLISS